MRPLLASWRIPGCHRRITSGYTQCISNSHIERVAFAKSAVDVNAPVSALQPLPIPSGRRFLPLRRARRASGNARCRLTTRCSRQRWLSPRTLSRLQRPPVLVRTAADERAIGISDSIFYQRQFMVKRARVTLAAVVISTVLGIAQTSRSIEVNITYAGSGTVDASHKVYIALWDSPNFSGAPPIAVKPLDSKSGTVMFADVQKVPAYVSAAYDPTGKWDAQSPPPSGSSVGMYSSNPPTPDPIDVAPGKTGRVKLRFDDTNKVP